MADNNNNDELVSQFLAFTGSADVDRAVSYLEMSGGNLETAVGLFMEHTTSGGGGGGDAAGGGGGIPGGEDFASREVVRAPDETRTMRLMDHHEPMIPGVGGMNPLMGALMQANDDEEDIMERASAFSRALDPRAAVNAAAAAAAAMNQDLNEEEEEETKQDDTAVPPQEQQQQQSKALGDMFAPPSHLLHKGGGFQGARAVAKDARRWLLVNIQKDSEFSTHALNRDVWRDDLVENLIREGFIFYQTYDTSTEGRTYSERYSVHDYPHVSIIDPRTGRLMWRKEGWTMESPLTAQDFAEMAMDFCSRHSFDKPPSANPHKRKSVDTTEQETSIMNTNGNNVAQEEEQEPSFVETLMTVVVGDEPESGARIQIRMPDAKRLVRKFAPTDSIRSIYAFVAQSNDEAKGGKEFTLSAGYPPKDLFESIDDTVESCGLAGEAITVRWK